MLAVMRNVVITGGTGDLGSVVVPRLEREYRCILLRRGERWVIDEPVYALVHLAGGFAAGSSADDFAKMFETNVFTAVKAVDATAPHLQDGGRIVAISSVATVGKPAGLAAYVAAKSALNAFIETLAKDLAERQITANAILPAAMDTPANAGQEKLVPRAQVAETIAFLLSDAASRITGQLIAMP